MFDKIIHFSLKYRLFIICVASILVAYGIITARHLPVDVLPDLNRPMVTIMTESAGLAPEEVETQITIPLERSLSGVPGLVRLRTVSGIGLSIIFLEFDWNSDVYRQRQLVSERLATITNELPSNAVPIMTPITSIMGEIMLLGISAEKAEITPMQLRTLAEWTIRPRLLSIPGIAQITTIGGEVKQYQVHIEPTLLHGYKLPISEIESSLKDFAQNTTGGFLENNSQEWLIRHIGLTTELSELRKTLVKVIDGTPVALENLTDVKVGPAVKRGDSSIDGKPAVILAIQKQPSANTLSLTETIESVVKDLEKTLPSSVKLHPQIFRQADFIEKSIGNVEEALRDGFILVTIILIIFLANTRTTLISLSAIPLSIIITMVIFKWFNMSINTMTLGGLAIAIGELVDDAIVDVENIFRRLRENKHLDNPKPALDVIFEASKEIRNSIVYATLIVILVFIPLLALDGVEGRLFAPLGIAYMVSIGASLFVSLTLTPALCYYLLPNAKAVEHHDSWLVRHLKVWDTKLLNWSLTHPQKIFFPTLLAFIIALISIPFLGKGFLPPFNEGTLTINLRLPPGASLSESNKIGTLAETSLKEIPEVISVARRTGRAEQDEHAEGVNNSDLEVLLKNDGRERSLIIAEVRERLSGIPGVILNIGQPISHRLDHMMSGVRAEIVLKIFGNDLKILRQKAEELKSELSGIPGLADLQIEQQVNIPQVQIRPDRVKSLLYGVNTNELITSLETLLNGKTITKVREGERPVDLVLRLSEKWRNRPDLLSQVLIEGNKGLIPINRVAIIDKTEGPNMINRENQQRRLVVMANVSGRDLNSVVADIQNNIKKLSLPTGYHIALEGQFKSQQEANQLIMILGIFSLILIYLVLYSHFRSPYLALVIMANIPMALIGSVAALWISGLDLTVASLVGFITLTGIASRNGILKVSHYIHLMKHEGESFTKEMVIRGSLERLTPVLMTALVAALALVPLLLNGQAPGKEILHPVAIVIFGGLISSTLLDTLLTPVIFWKLGEEKITKALED
ncbi:MAG: efflux RND transporter permease subunit [Alphaproteobacteria bacterium]|jgi:CzcA family heavy metal efflux pump